MLARARVFEYSFRVESSVLGACLWNGYVQSMCGCFSVSSA